MRLSTSLAFGSRARQVTAFVALQDVDQSMGPTSFLPGTHRDAAARDVALLVAHNANALRCAHAPADVALLELVCYSRDELGGALVDDALSKRPRAARLVEASIFCDLLRDSLNTTSYLAEQANLFFDVALGDRGLGTHLGVFLCCTCHVQPCTSDI